MTLSCVVCVCACV